METNLSSTKSVKLVFLAIVSGLVLWLSLSYLHNNHARGTQKKAGAMPADVSSVPPQADNQQ